MQADAAPHDDRRLWPDVVDHHRGRRPLRRHLVSLSLATCLELARFLEMSPASVAPVAARLEKMRIPKFLPSVITSLRQVGPVWGGHPHTRQRGADAEELRRFGPTTAECPDDTGACPDHAFEGVAPVDPFAFHGSKARHSAFHREDTPARPLIPGDERISSPSMWVRRGYRQEARTGTQATQHRFASQDGTIFETHNRDDRLVGPFSTEVT
jgi:hypothetical protein